MAFSDIKMGNNRGKRATQILSPQELGVLNEKSNLKGFFAIGWALGCDGWEWLFVGGKSASFGRSPLDTTDSLIAYLLGARDKDGNRAWSCGQYSP